MKAPLKTKFLRWFVSVTIPVALLVSVKFMYWRNDSHINAAEREARKVLGLQFYGAINCGLIQKWEPTYVDDSEDIEYQKTVNRAVNQYNNRVPFIYFIEEVEPISNLQDFALHTLDYRAIAGTRSGAIYEFWWDGKDYQNHMKFLHRKWQKPTIQHKGNAILFFDASQSAKK